MKRDLNPRWSGAPSPPTGEGGLGPPGAWRADLAVRLARRIRRPDDRIVPLALELLRGSEATPPDHEPLVAAWSSAVGVAKDPLMPHLLSKIFEAAGAGRVLVNEALTPKPSRWLALASRRTEQRSRERERPQLSWSAARFQGTSARLTRAINTRVSRTGHLVMALHHPPVVFPASQAERVVAP
ncbi:hypothetical protein ACQP25_26515 [Microtetraspora malaysiensis]|uniref:hypothetical protein n=1 Tax=Microtetraspora malaysiensis TaxID=161358 RepID=UPI003D91E06F